MSLFNELKRRNVFRVGIAYAIAAWIILQVTDVVGEIMELPEWGGKLILLMLLVGFPIALIFAWAFELTPEGIKRESDVDRSESIAPQTGKKLNNTILVLMALAIVYLLFDKFSGNRPDSVSTPAAEVAQVAEQPETEPAPDSEPAISRQSIAVLPFDNRSPRAEDEYFAEGIHDDLLTTLSRIGALKVISRTSVLRYRDTELPIPDIARELGVATVMEGAVQRSGNQVRINVQLIDAQTDEHLWAEIFDRELTAENLFAIQSEISEAIASALQAELTNEEEEQINRLPTEDLTAYDAYLRGRQLMATRNSEKLEQAIEEFRTAVTLDPEFALAWVGLADSYALLSDYGTLPEMEGARLREEAAQRALAIDPDLGEAYASMGGVHFSFGRDEAGEEAFKRAIALSPNYATAYQWYALRLGSYPTRANEQLELTRKAAELDPTSPIIQLNLGFAYIRKDLISAAERQFTRLIELHPDFSRGYVALAYLEGNFKGRLDRAVEWTQKARQADPGGLFNYSIAANMYANLRDEAAMQSMLTSMEEMAPDHALTARATLRFSLNFRPDAATREVMAWAEPKMNDGTDSGFNSGFLHLVLGDLERAREGFLGAEPRWTQPEHWDRLLASQFSNACEVSWVLERTGDPELGKRLRAEARKYFDEYLPPVNDDIDFYGPETCQLADGEYEQALDTITMQLEHGHLTGWTVWHRLPLFDAVRDNPRYLDIMARYEALIAEQRARVADMNAEAGP